MATNGDQAEAEQVVDPSGSEDQDIEASVRYIISSYGADYPVDGLVKRIGSQHIFVPSFQRGFVWSHVQASRFVESLLLGLPVPGIFLFKEPDTQRLLVVDGQQRLRSLQMFYDGVIRGKEFALRGVTEELLDKTYKTLNEEDRRRLDDSILHATIFQQEDPDDDRGSIYLIFERLNSGGTPLAPQEIRSCVYRGAFNELLTELAQNAKWREVYGPMSSRGKDQELILRFFALLLNQQNYKRPMKGFLNDFMDDNRNPSPERIAELRDTFVRVITLAADNLTRAAFRPERNLNAAVLDAFMIGLARRVAAGPIKEPARLAQAAQDVLAQEAFVTAVNSGTTDLPVINSRIEAATTAFLAVP